MNIANITEIGVAEANRSSPRGLTALFSDTRQGFSSLVDATTVSRERRLFDAFRHRLRPLSNEGSPGGGSGASLGAVAFVVSWTPAPVMTLAASLFGGVAANAESPGGGSTVALGATAFTMTWEFPSYMTLNQATGPTNL